MVAVILTAACAAAQTPSPATTIVEPPTPLLPTTDKLVLPTPEFAAPDDSAQTQTILKEDGLVRTESRVALTPAASKPASPGWVRAYQFVDATGAMSAYTYFRQGGKPDRDHPVNATQVQNGDGEVVFLSGVNVVRAKLKLYPESASTLLAQVATGLPKVSGRKALAPLLPTTFPADVSGTKPDLSTVRYSLGPVGYQTMGGQLPPEILGWDKSAEVATAAYSGRAGKGTLTLLIYPTPQVAADRGRAIEQAINDRGPATFGTVKLRRVGPLLSLTSGGFAPDQAQKLVEAVHLNEVVTFDQKMPLEFHAEVKKTATLLEEILIFTGILTIAALVIGIFLGGARAGWRVLHGKPAASEPEFLTINLRDPPKALFAAKTHDPNTPEP